MKLKIRRVFPKETKIITHIHLECVTKSNAKVYTKKEIEEWTSEINATDVRIQLKNCEWYLLFVDGIPAGFSQFSTKKAVLYQINVLPQCQNKGYGKFLYNFVEKQFIKEGIKKISLNATLNAKSFYKKMGFKFIKEIRFPLKTATLRMFKMEKEIFK